MGRVYSHRNRIAYIINNMFMMKNTYEITHPSGRTQRIEGYLVKDAEGNTVICREVSMLFTNIAATVPENCLIHQIIPSAICQPDQNDVLRHLREDTYTNEEINEPTGDRIR